jgi:hypothetical protein
MKGMLLAVRPGRCRGGFDFGVTEVDRFTLFNKPMTERVTDRNNTAHPFYPPASH